MSETDAFRGGSESARNKLNNIRDEVISLSKIKGDNKFISVIKTPSGVNVLLNVPAILTLLNNSLSSLRPLVITAINDDTLTGRYLYPDGDGGLDTGTVNVTVLKPWTLRRTPFDGLTVNGVAYEYTDAQTRDADDGDNQETQYVTQDYFVDAIIYVMPVNEAGADVIDTNVDGRAWAQLD